MAENELFLLQNWNEENEILQMFWPHLMLSVNALPLNTKLQQRLLFSFDQIVFLKPLVGKFNDMLVDDNS